MTHQLEQFVRSRAERPSPEEVLRWAWETFAPAVVASSSFQTQSVPLLHMISRVCPEMPVFFIDTGFHFPETLAFRDRLQERFGLNVVVVTPDWGPEEFRRRYGKDVHHRDPDLCCHLNKVVPLQGAMEGVCAWVAGVRRAQTSYRRRMPALAPQISGVIKVHPLLEWTDEEMEDYRRRYDLPAHPLEAQGYRSVGCQPCTRPVDPDEGARAGRWAGQDKEECGLHLERPAVKFDHIRD